MTVISQSEVNTLLANKLNQTDIDKSSEFCKRSALKNRLLLEIAGKHGCNCSQKENRLFAFPEGNPSSPIMFIGEPPSDYDGVAKTTMFDANGRLLTVILDKLGLKRDNIYITNVAKCCVKDDDAQAVSYVCAAHFLIREITLVEPKLIITLGVIPANIIRVIFNDAEEIEDPNAIKGLTSELPIGNATCKVIHTYSPAFVLSKAGSMYTKYKTDLWNDIQGAWASLKK